MPISRTIAWMVWAIASVFYAYQYMLRVMPSIMMNDITQQFNIDAATFGQFSGVYYLGYSLMHLPLGILLDRYGPKKIMPVCIVLTVIGLTPILWSTFWVYPIIGRALIGIGSSAAILGAFKIIRLTFSEQKFTRMLSLAVTIGLIGAIYGGGPVNYLCTIWGYKTIVGLFALLGLGLALLTYWIMPEIETHRSTSAWSDIREVFSNRTVLLICFFAGCMVGPLEGFADVWGSAFLKNVYETDATISATMPSAIFIGMCFGSPLLSLLAEKTKSYLGTIVGCGLLMTLSFIALLSGRLTIEMMSPLFILVGVCSAYQIIAIYQASTYVKEHVSGLTTAATNMIIMIFGYVFHSIIGWTVQAFGGTAHKEALLWGIGVIPVALTIGTLGFWVLNLKVGHMSRSGLPHRKG